jgi:hypothetical protein
MKIIMASDIVEENGKTIRQNNLERAHKIPIGALVEIISADDPLDVEPTRGLRLFVVHHSRDCDGSPLYSLSFSRKAQEKLEEVDKNADALRRDGLYVMCHSRAQGALLGGYDEDSLTVIRLPGEKLSEWGAI